ncbi:unnamed protein product [Prunus armeniaca]
MVRGVLRICERRFLASDLRQRRRFPTKVLRRRQFPATSHHLVNKPSTSIRVEVTEADVSVAAPGEGVLTVITGWQKVPITRLKGPLFGVDFLEPNALTEGELAKIKAEYHIPDSVMMRIPGPLESLSNM